MNSANPWSLLRGGEAERDEGVRQLKKIHTQDPDASNIMELGVAYLWLHRYQSALEHFQNALQTFHIKGDAFYGMAGVANWCLGQPNEAVRYWRAGLKAKYARANALNVVLPLLLFATSVIKPEASQKEYSEKLLRQKCRDLRIRIWPGPIAEYVLGNKDYKSLQNQCKGHNDDETRARHWLAEFYQIVISYNECGSFSFKNCLRQISDTSRSEFSDVKYFISVLWHEEFFIARHEASNN